MLIDNLTKEQQEVINIACGKFNVLVDACIGSGKTTTINMLCKEYIKNYPDKHIVYLTYNQLLKWDAQNKIGYHPNIFVTNYHGYARKYINEKHRNNVSNYINIFLEEDPVTPTIDLLIIDEYQDIDTEIANMLSLIKKNNPKMQIVAVGDMHQKIYDKTHLDVKQFITDFLDNHVLKTFTYCFRLNDEYAKRIGKIWNKPIIGVNNDCTIHTMNLSEVCDYLKDKPLGDILVLGKQTNGIGAALLNKLETTLPKKFNRNTIFVKDRENYAKITQDNMNKLAIFTTYDGSKGLEKSICVITDFTRKYIDGRIAMGTKPEILKNIFCVAMSRGKNNIVFIQPTETELKSEALNSEDKNRILAKDELLYDLKHQFVVPNHINVVNLMAYKYNENINKCFNMIDKQHIEMSDKEIIYHDNKCGFIDLSRQNIPVILANFFERYDIEEETEILSAKYKTAIPDWMKPSSIDGYARVMAYVKTGQLRYYTQVPSLNFTEADINIINKRLTTVFTGDEEFTNAAESDLSDIIDPNIIINALPKNISNRDRTDAIKNINKMKLTYGTYLMDNDTYYSLIFDEGICNENSYSTIMRDAMIDAMFISSVFSLKYTKIWNIQTNQMYELSTPDKDKFVANVICTYLNLQLPY